ncbi:hypothetical protein DJ84_05725 [Halorubrum ezzemoulense]|nr:hypothetical protein DJ84_05725 [Halorubrum ezzemoulense]
MIDLSGGNDVILDENLLPAKVQLACFRKFSQLLMKAVRHKNDTNIIFDMEDARLRVLVSR